jgi:hypothetical protein
MSRIQTAVRQFVAPPALAGGPAKGASFDQRSLQKELARLRQGREIAFWLCFGALVIVLALSITFLIQHRDDAETIQKMSAATGLTVLGIVAAMTKLWQDKVKADLVLALANGMSETSLKEALLKLLDKL